MKPRTASPMQRNYILSTNPDDEGPMGPIPPPLPQPKCRTLADMSAAEIAALEARYGARVILPTSKEEP